MEIGPVEVVIIEFPGNEFKGEIVPALRDVVANGTVRIIDLLGVIKDEDGSVTSVEISGLDERLDPVFAELSEYSANGVLDDEDVATVAENLAPNSSAFLLVWENTWAARFAAAVRNANGRVVDRANIPHEDAVAALEAAGA